MQLGLTLPRRSPTLARYSVTLGEAMQGSPLSINERLREERAGQTQSTFDAAQVSAAHECILLARRHPQVWPVLNEVSLLRRAARLTGWQPLRQFNRSCRPCRIRRRAMGTRLYPAMMQADISACQLSSRAQKKRPDDVCRGRRKSFEPAARYGAAKLPRAPYSAAVRIAIEREPLHSPRFRRADRRMLHIVMKRG